MEFIAGNRRVPFRTSEGVIRPRVGPLSQVKLIQFAGAAQGRGIDGIHDPPEGAITAGRITDATPLIERLA